MSFSEEDNINNKVILLQEQSNVKDIYMQQSDYSKRSSGIQTPNRPESQMDIDINREGDNIIFASSSILNSNIDVMIAKSLIYEYGMDCLNGTTMLSTDLTANVLNTHLVKRHLPKRNNKINSVLQRYPLFKEYLKLNLSNESKHFINNNLKLNDNGTAVENILKKKSDKLTFDKSILLNRNSYYSETTSKLITQLGLRDLYMDATISKSQNNQALAQETLYGLTDKVSNIIFPVDSQLITSQNSQSTKTDTNTSLSNKRDTEVIKCTNNYGSIMQGIQLNIVIINNMVYTTSSGITIPTRTGYRTIESTDQIKYLIDTLMTGLSVPLSSTAILSDISKYVNDYINDQHASTSIRTIIPGVRLVLHDSIYDRLNKEDNYSIFNYSILFDESYAEGLNSNLLESMSSKYIQLHITNIQYDNNFFSLEKGLPIVDDLLEGITDKNIDIAITFLNKLKSYYKALNNSTLDLNEPELIGSYQQNEQVMYYYSYITGKSSLVERLDADRYGQLKFVIESAPTPQDPYLGTFNTIATIALYLPIIYSDDSPILRSHTKDFHSGLFEDINIGNQLHSKFYDYIKGLSENIKAIQYSESHNKIVNNVYFWYDRVNVLNKGLNHNTTRPQVKTRGDYSYSIYDRGYNLDNTFILDINKDKRTIIMNSASSTFKRRRTSINFGDPFESLSDISTIKSINIAKSIREINYYCNLNFSSNDIILNLGGINCKYKTSKEITKEDYLYKINQCIFSSHVNTVEEALLQFKTLQNHIISDIIKLSNLINQISSIKTTNSDEYDVQNILDIVLNFT